MRMLLFALGFAAIPFPATVQAISIAPWLRHQTDRVREFVTGVFADTQLMICDEYWKFVL